VLFPDIVEMRNEFLRGAEPEEPRKERVGVEESAPGGGLEDAHHGVLEDGAIVSSGLAKGLIHPFGL